MSSPFGALGLQAEQTAQGESAVYSRPGRDASPRRDASSSPQRDSYSPSRRGATPSSPAQPKGARSGERGVGPGVKYSPIAESYSSTPPRNMDMGKITSPRAGQRQMSPSRDPGGMSLQAEIERLQVRFPVSDPTEVIAKTQRQFHQCLRACPADPKRVLQVSSAKNHIYI